MRVHDVRTGVFHIPPGARYGPRALGLDWELLWVLDGSVTWTREAQWIAMAPGDLLLIPPGPDDAFAWDRARPTSGGATHFRMDGASAGLGLGASGVRCAMTGQDPLAGLCEYLVWLGALPAAEGQERMRQVVELLVGIVVDGPQAGRAEAVELPPPLRAAVAHVGRVWAAEGVRPVALDELARAAALSRRQFSRLTASALGVGPVKAFELARLGRVATLLAHSNLTLAEIAAACGYADPFHLSRRFTAEYAVAPRRYRDLARARAPLPEPPAGPQLRTLVHGIEAAARAWPRLKIG